MGSPCELHLYGPAALRAEAYARARAEVERLEAKYSRYRDDSVLSRLNAAAGQGPQTVDEETAGLLDFAAQAHAQSDGLFDPSSGVLREVWSFHPPRLPESEALQACLARLGWQRLQWQRPRLSLPAGMELDFGGFVKEYAADAAAAALKTAGLQYALVNLGGDIAILGPHPDGRPWQLGVRDPRDPARALAQIPLSAGALASSGDYERYFIQDGQRYCHILNPRSGWPVQGLASVSVVAPQCLIAGVASTVAMLLPPEAALNWLNGLGLAYFAVDQTGEVFQAGAAGD